MTQITPIKPFLTEEGIELYSTDIGTGSSIRGTSRLSGTAISNIQQIITVLENPDDESLKGRPGAVTTIQASESLKPYLNGSIWLETLDHTLNNAKILKSEVVAAIVEYYAFEKNNDTAKFAYRKFAKMGIDSWIRATTGHAIVPAIDPAQLAIQLLLENKAQSEKITALHEVTIELQKEVLENERYMTKATLKAPGLQMLLDEAQYCSEGDRLPEQSGNVKTAYTLAEWLEEYKYPVPDKMYRQLRLAVAETFKSLRWYRPQKEDRYVEGKRRPAYVYKPEDFHYLDTCFSQVSASYRP